MELSVRLSIYLSVPFDPPSPEGRLYTHFRFGGINISCRCTVQRRQCVNQSINAGNIASRTTATIFDDWNLGGHGREVAF